MTSPWLTHASTVTRIVIRPEIDPRTSEGLCAGYRSGAGQCLAAAKQITLPDTTPVFILTFHAIELVLKAFLARSGMNAEQLAKRPYGHNLVKLYDEAKGRGLSINLPNVDDMLACINKFHYGEGKGSPVRYEFAEVRTLPICEAHLYPFVQAVADATR